MLFDERDALRVSGRGKGDERSGGKEVRVARSIRAVARQGKGNRPIDGVPQRERQYLHVEHTEASSDRGLTLAIRVPRKSDSRFKVAQRRIGKQWRAGHGCRIREMVQRR